MSNISDTLHCLRLKIYNVLENGSASIFRQKGEWESILVGYRLPLSKGPTTDTFSKSCRVF
jgi:hypothetical protein